MWDLASEKVSARARNSAPVWDWASEKVSARARESASVWDWASEKVPARARNSAPVLARERNRSHPWKLPRQTRLGWRCSRNRRV
jgi:hypothetical protein